MFWTSRFQLRKFTITISRIHLHKIKSEVEIINREFAKLQLDIVKFKTLIHEGEIVNT
jgi:hypothetical protein